MRDLLTASLLLVIAILCAPAFAADAGSVLDIRVLDPAAGDATAEAVNSGSLDGQFVPFQYREVRRHTNSFWLRVQAPAGFMPHAVPTLNIGKGRHLALAVYWTDASGRRLLPVSTELPDFRGAHEVVYILPQGLRPGHSVYVHVEASGTGSEELRMQASTLDATLERAKVSSRMIALTFGALMAMAVTALLVWLVLSDKLLLLYATLFALQALYMAFLSGEAFDWPVLSYALPFVSYTWNVCAALSGAAACLFVREIAELRRFSPRIYTLFGALAVTFVVLAAANVAQEIGLGNVVASIGNLIFIGASITTLVVAFLAWRRHNRAAGWFLIAWGLLEAFTIATAVSLLTKGAHEAAGLLYFGLPLSMVAAAVLIALGVADRLRDQRLALTDAERRAQTDALTGVLNRRSLIERLDAACFRARARGLPVALLFIDLDHFKEINDTYGHPAGDACLKAIIDPIHAELRQSDVIGRYGGEEFVVILSSADMAAAQPIAERIRARVADVRVEGFGAPISLTCSIGVASSDMLGVWGEHLIARADEAVYVAKRAGRNRVQIAAPLAA